MSTLAPIHPKLPDRPGDLALQAVADERPRGLAEVLAPPAAQGDDGLQLSTCQEIESLEAYAVSAAMAAEVTLYRRAAARQPEELDMGRGAEPPARGIGLAFDPFHTGDTAVPF